MSRILWLSDEKIGRIQPFFSKSYSKPGVASRYDRRPKVFLSAIVLIGTVIFWL